jgi:hypothetical protein
MEIYSYPTRFKSPRYSVLVECAGVKVIINHFEYDEPMGSTRRLKFRYVVPCPSVITVADACEGCMNPLVDDYMKEAVFGLVLASLEQKTVELIAHPGTDRADAKMDDGRASGGRPVLTI